MIELHQELARAIVDGLPVGIALVDTKGCVVWGNGALGELLQRDEGDIIGRDAESLPLPLPDPQTSRPESTRILEKGSLIGVSRELKSATFNGQTLLVVDRKNAIDWFFEALAVGGFDASAGSRFLSRNAVSNRVQLEVSRSRRYANPLSCMVIRVDFGTADTDEHRRAVRDLIAGTLTEQLRWVDVLGQWSDRTLVVILPETTDAAALRLAEKVTAALIPNLAREMPAASVSTGVSSWRKGDDAERLIRRADTVARGEIEKEAATANL
ncbi:MAG TPA: diguanylate cyclase [Gammaproteobacteria bacterium]|jgi:GGDEF domain-containing protein|nr:diguanylate cyclase [Gammaproteobacteria bacterium]